jgi:formiminoglutamase
MSFSSYFKEDFVIAKSAKQGSLGEYITDYSEDVDFKDFDFALIFINQGESNQNHFETLIMEQVSTLFPAGFEPRILNMGILVKGASSKDTEAAVADIAEELITARVIPIIIGDRREITIAAYKAFEKTESVVNLTAIDNTLNIQNGAEEGYMSTILQTQPNYLFNFSNIGYQTYLTDPKELSLADELFFDAYRLGEVRGNILSTEPIVRGSEIVTFSMDVVKSSDFSSNYSPQPNGIYAEEICQLMRFAALSEKSKVILITDINFESASKVDALLVAEMLWCFFEGFYMRKTEMPHAKSTGFLKYRVALKEDEFHLIFYKSVKTDRWWMEVPVPPEFANKYRKHHLIPCNYDDYKVATEDDLPDRWWKAYKKML